MKPMLRGALMLCAAAALAGCQSMPATRSSQTGPACALPPVANDAFLSTLWQQRAAEYDALSLQVYARALERLDLAMADPQWNALSDTERVDAPASQGVAVITDVDETLVDNSAFAVREMREPTSGCQSPAEAREAWALRWRDWVQSAQAPALAGAAEFMQMATQRGATVFYVTNRKDDEKSATCENLRATGFPLSDCARQVLTRNEEAGRGRDKVSRRQQVAAHYRVLMLFGDNLGDFAGGVLDSEAERDQLVAARQSWWGERWFILPNPSYGSWEEVLGRILERPDDFATAGERAAYVRELKQKKLEDCRQRDCLKP